jgi:hypothetical protein
MCQGYQRSGTVYTMIRIKLLILSEILCVICEFEVYPLCLIQLSNSGISYESLNIRPLNKLFFSSLQTFRNASTLHLLSDSILVINNRTSVGYVRLTRDTILFV